MSVLNLTEPETPRRRADDTQADLPDWPGLILKLGVIPALLVFVVYTGVSSYQSVITDTHDRIVQHELQAAASRAILQKHADEMIQLRLVLIKICDHTAKNQYERAECYRGQ